MSSLLSGWDAPPRTFLTLLVALTVALFLLPQSILQRPFRFASTRLSESAALTILAILLWTALVTAEYWALGKHSLIVFGDEGGLSFPYFAHLARFPRWGTPHFDPSVLGGSEITGLLANGGSLFSLEIWEFRVFGPEGGFVLHKILNSFFATSGAFLVARNGIKAPYVFSLLIGFGYSVSFLYVDAVTLVHGLGYGLIPFAIYMVIYRSDRKHYYLGCLGFALLLSASMSISHSNIALYVALFSVAAYEGLVWRRRFWLGIAILTTVIAVVWADVLYAMLSFVALTPRGQASADLKDSFNAGYLWHGIIDGYFYVANTVPVVIAVVVVSRFRRPLLATVGLALCPWLLALIYTVMPFRRMGLGVLETIDPIYLYFASPAVLVVVLSVAAAELFPAEKPEIAVKGFSAEKFFVSFVLALTLSSFVAAKHFDLLMLIGGSSRTMYYIPNIEELARTADPAYRVLAGPDANNFEYFSDNVLLAYGLATIGGYFNLVDWWHNEYWKRAGVGSNRGYAGLTSGVTDCADVYELKTVDLLRIAGVRYLVSRTRVDAPGLRLISGPPDAVSEGCLARKFDRVRLAFQSNRPIRDAFIYELPPPLPVAYFAGAARHSSSSIASDAFWDEVRQYGLDRTVSSADIAADEPFDEQAEILSLHRDIDGYSLETRSRDTALLVLNHPALPFWRVAVDGIRAPLISANGIHMAVRVPPGRHTLVFSYCRWMPSDGLKAIVSAFTATAVTDRSPIAAQLCRAG